MHPSQPACPGAIEELQFLNDQIVTCRRCASMPPERRRVPGHGPAEPVLMFVGEAPGRFGADRTGVPFSGDRSGQFLRELIRELGLEAEREVYITNVVRCNPRDPRGNNRAPDRTEVAACRQFLEAELRLLRPRVVVPLGTLACRILLDRPLREVRATPIQRDGQWYFPLYHPSYAASYGYPREQYRREFLALASLLPSLHRVQQGGESDQSDRDPDGADEGGAAVFPEPATQRAVPAAMPFPDAPSLAMRCDTRIELLRRW